MFLEDMNLLLQIISFQIHLQWTVVSNKHKSLWERDSLVADVYPMISGKQFVNILEDNIRRRGAMDKLLSDSAKTEISKKVMDIL